jgi:hypothetical protein
MSPTPLEAAQRAPSRPMTIFPVARAAITCVMVFDIKPEASLGTILAREFKSVLRSSAPAAAKNPNSDRRKNRSGNTARKNNMQVPQPCQKRRLCQYAPTRGRQDSKATSLRIATVMPCPKAPSQSRLGMRSCGRSMAESAAGKRYPAVEFRLTVFRLEKLRGSISMY